MNVSISRPNVSDLIFRFFERSVHPELFTFQQTRLFQHGPFELRVSLCGSGHVIEYRLEEQVLGTEVISSSEHPLPRKKQVTACRIRGTRDHRHSFAENQIHYHNSCQLEEMTPEIYLSCHQELMVDSRKAVLMYRFPSETRTSPAPISLIHLNLCQNGLGIHTFHTFPDHHAIVRTQSLIER